MTNYILWIRCTFYCDTPSGVGTARDIWMSRVPCPVRDAVRYGTSQNFWVACPVFLSRVSIFSSIRCFWQEIRRFVARKRVCEVKGKSEWFTRRVIIAQRIPRDTFFFENSASEENFSMFYGYFEKSRYGTVRTIGLENYDKSRGIRYGTGQVLQIPSRAQPWLI